MYDVAVIGAGIVGSCIARELSKYELRCILIDKSYDIANGSTKANSGIVHAGYDPIEGTLKAKLNVEGNKMYTSLCSELQVDYKNSGSLVLAFNDADMKTIEVLYNRGIKNGVKKLGIIEKNEVLRIEPNINDGVRGALIAEAAGIVSPYELTVALCENANQNGVEFMFSTEVVNINKAGDVFNIDTNKSEIKVRFIVNAAGLFADNINRMIRGREFKIIPRKGEYCLLDKSQGSIVKRVIFQPPTDRGKGILVAPTVHGNLIIGPNSVVIEDKCDTSTTCEGLNEVINGALKSIKEINPREIITSFTGIRANPDTRDFIINIPSRGVVNAAGIESPGLTAAPAIALMVLELLMNQGLKLEKKKVFIKNRVNPKRFIDMTAEEKRNALKGNTSYGNVICRCEYVTEGDIVNAIKRPLGAKTVDGIKKRLRAGMGRCQGGFCMPRVVEILARELNVSPKEILKSGEGSYILTGRTK